MLNVNEFKFSYSMFIAAHGEAKREQSQLFNDIAINNSESFKGGRFNRFTMQN